MFMDNLKHLCELRTIRKSLVGQTTKSVLNVFTILTAVSIYLHCFEGGNRIRAKPIQKSL